MTQIDCQRYTLGLSVCDTNRLSALHAGIACVRDTNILSAFDSWDYLYVTQIDCQRQLHAGITCVRDTNDCQRYTLELPVHETQIDCQRYTAGTTYMRHRLSALHAGTTCVRDTNRLSALHAGITCMNTMNTFGLYLARCPHNSLLLPGYRRTNCY